MASRSVQYLLLAVAVITFLCFFTPPWASTGTGSLFPVAVGAASVSHTVLFQWKEDASRTRVREVKLPTWGVLSLFHAGARPRLSSSPGVCPNAGAQGDVCPPGLQQALHPRPERRQGQLDRGQAGKFGVARAMRRMGPAAFPRADTARKRAASPTALSSTLPLPRTETTMSTMTRLTIPSKRASGISWRMLLWLTLRMGTTEAAVCALPLAPLNRWSACGASVTTTCITGTEHPVMKGGEGVCRVKTGRMVAASPACLSPRDMIIPSVCMITLSRVESSLGPSGVNPTQCKATVALSPTDGFSLLGLSAIAPFVQLTRLIIPRSSDHLKGESVSRVFQNRSQRLVKLNRVSEP